MDILSAGLLLMMGYGVVQVWDLLQNKLYRSDLFAELGLEDYLVLKRIRTAYGSDLIVSIPKGGSVDQLSAKKSSIESAFKCKATILDIPFSDKVKIEIVTRDFDEIDFEPVEASGYELLAGYDYKSEPLLVSMLKTCHLLVTGLGGNGKTGMIRAMIKNLLVNKNANIILFNGYDEDYMDLEVQNIKDHDVIKGYIQKLLNGPKLKKPLYVFFEELGSVKDKDLVILITQLLQYGRHNNIFLVGIIQRSTNEELKFKSLFNARLTFKQVDDSSYKVVLGCSVDDTLKKREFYLFTDDLRKGKTYNLPW